MIHDAEPDGTPDFTILSLPYAGGTARVAVSDSLLHRAPWFRQALESVVWVGGSYWPDNIRLLDEKEYEASSGDIHLFVVPEWVFDAPAPKKPRTKRDWKQRFLLLASTPVYRKVRQYYAGRSAAHGAFLLADALYQQLQSREMALCDLTTQEQFRNDVYSTHFAPQLDRPLKGYWMVFLRCGWSSWCFLYSRQSNSTTLSSLCCCACCCSSSRAIVNSESATRACAEISAAWHESLAKPGPH